MEARHLDPCVGGILDCGKKVFVSVVESHGERAVDDPAVDVDTEVNLHNVPLLQHHILLTWVGCVMSDLMVEAQAGGKTHAGLEAVTGLQSRMTQQRPHAIFNAFGDGQKSLARLDAFLYPSSSLIVHLGGFAVVLEENVVFRVPMSFVACFSSRCRCLGVTLHFPLGIVAGREEVAQQDSWW